MLLNIFILLFLVAMVVLWAQYGLFSAMMHFGVLVVAGSIALGLWEPIAQGLLMGRMPHYAWGVGLLGPLALMLILFRGVQDRMVGVSVQVPHLVSKIGGGVFGFFSGVLTTGLLVIGFGFMALPSDLLGHQRFTILGDGQVDMANRKRLWIPVDDMTEGFFSRLSTGAFSTGTPLAMYQPKLADQAGLYRLRVDARSSPSLYPGSVRVQAAWTHPARIEAMPDAIAELLGPGFKDRSRQLVVVQTRWLRQPATFDTDGTLRVLPSQVRLVTAKKEAMAWTEPDLVAPIAFRGKTDTTHTRPYFHPIRSDNATAFGLDDQEDITFVFLVPQDREPRFVLARHMRLPLPEEPSHDSLALVEALGPVSPTLGAVAVRPSGGASFNLPAGSVVGPDETGLAVSNKLPVRISKNDAQGLRFDNVNDINAITSGEDTAKEAGFGFGTRRYLTHFDEAPHRPLVMMRLRGDKAKAFFGSSSASQTMQLGVTLVDDRGNRPKPVAVVWLKSDASQYIHYKPAGATFNSGAEIGVIPRMQSYEDLLLFFPVNRGSRITGYQIGQADEVELARPLVVQ